jgi:ABC-type transport system involved in multi-copper enzyme maturation permease subunit
MNSVPRTTRETPIPSPIRRDTVVMGRADYMSTVLRLIGVELYKIRRRTMSKILSVIGIFVMLIAFFAIALTPIIIAREDTHNFLPPPCSSVSHPGIETCLTHPPTAADLQHAEQAKMETVSQDSTSLQLPDSLHIANIIMQNIGLLLVVILAGTIVGGEYSVGTIRLMFTRGPTRSQFILAKAGAILTCIIIGLPAGILIGVIAGAIFNLLTGTDASFAFLTVSWIIHLVLYLLVSILGLFTYAMLALCLATLGRTTAAGVAGALVWWVLENILGSLLSAVGTQIGGVLGDVLRAIPTYFIGSNVGALLQNQVQYLDGSTSAQTSDLQALLVLAFYVALSIGLAWWVTQRRDITN